MRDGFIINLEEKKGQKLLIININLISNNIINNNIFFFESNINIF